MTFLFAVRVQNERGLNLETGGTNPPEIMSRQVRVNHCSTNAEIIFSSFSALARWGESKDLRRPAFIQIKPRAKFGQCPPDLFSHVIDPQKKYAPRGGEKVCFPAPFAMTRG